MFNDSVSGPPSLAVKARAGSEPVKIFHQPSEDSEISLGSVVIRPDADGFVTSAADWIAPKYSHADHEWSHLRIENSKRSKLKTALYSFLPSGVPVGLRKTAPQVV